MLHYIRTDGIAEQSIYDTLEAYIEETARRVAFEEGSTDLDDGYVAVVEIVVEDKDVRSSVTKSTMLSMLVEDRADELKQESEADEQDKRWMSGWRI